MRLSSVTIVLAFGALLAACSTPDPYTGEPFARQKHIDVRRPSPVREELEARPAPPYEDVLRAQDARKAKLEVPKEVRQETRWLDEGRRDADHAIGPTLGPQHDAFESYEKDRQAVLVREWSDTGKPEAPTPEPKKERVVEEDPYAPAPKVGKKPGEGEGDKPAEGEGEKKPDDAGGDKKPDDAGGDKKSDAKKGE